MSVEKPPFLVLSPALQTYAWGKRGSQSAACRLKASADPDFTPDENQTYAEVALRQKFTPLTFDSRYCSYSYGWERTKRVQPSSSTLNLSRECSSLIG